MIRLIPVKYGDRSYPEGKPDAAWAEFLRLRMVLDFPQLFTAYNLGPGKFTAEKIRRAMGPLFECRELIAGS